jgi:hypothetical protein
VVKELLLEILIENDYRNYEHQSTHQRSDTNDVSPQFLLHVFALVLPFAQRA